MTDLIKRVERLERVLSVLAFAQDGERVDLIITEMVRRARAEADIDDWADIDD